MNNIREIIDHVKKGDVVIASEPVNQLDRIPPMIKIHSVNDKEVIVDQDDYPIAYVKQYTKFYIVDHIKEVKP